MATSAYSTQNQSYNIGGFESVDYIGEVQRAIQGKIDVNKEKTNEVMKRFAAVDLARPQDREAFINKLEGIVGFMNGSEGLDFRDNSLPSAIDAELNRAFDSETMKQIENTKNIRKFGAAVEKKREEGKGKYNQVNEWYAKQQAGYEDYMSGKTNDLGNMVYEDYVDVYGTIEKEFQKNAKDILMETGVDVTNMSGSQILQVTKSKSLKGSKIRDYVQSKIDNTPELQRQILMNGAYDYKDISTEDIKTGYRRSQDMMIESLSKEKEAIEGKMMTLSEGSEAYETLKGYKESREMNIDRLNSAKDLNLNRSQYEYQMAMDRLVETFVKTNEKYEVTDVKYDDVYARDTERNFRMQMAKEQFAFDKEKFAYKKEFDRSKANKDTPGGVELVTNEVLDDQAESKSPAERMADYAENRKEEVANYVKNHYEEKGEKITIEQARGIVTGLIDSTGEVVSHDNILPSHIMKSASELREYYTGINKISEESTENYINNVQKEVFNSVVKDKAKHVFMGNLRKISPVHHEKLEWAINNGKTYDDLSQDDKVLMAMEGLRQHRNSRNSEEKPSDLSSGGYLATSYLYKKYPHLKKQLDEVGHERDSNFMQSRARLVGNNAGKFWNTLVSPIEEGFTAIFNNKKLNRVKAKNARKQYEYDKNIEQAAKDADYSSYVFFGPDAGITQLDETDVNNSQNTFSGGLKNIDKEVRVKVENMAEKYKEFGNAIQSKTLHMDPTRMGKNSKEVQAYSQAIASARNSGITVKPNEPIQIVSTPDGYTGTIYRTNNKGVTTEVNFDIKKEDSSKLSLVMSDQIERSQPGGFGNSIMWETKTEYNIPKNKSEQQVMFQRLNKQSPHIYTKDSLHNPGNGLNTASYYKDKATIAGGIKDPELLKEVDRLLSKSYYTTMENFLGSNQIAVYDRASKEAKPVYITNFKDYDLEFIKYEDYGSIIPIVINQYIEQQILDIANKQMQINSK